MRAIVASRRAFRSCRDSAAASPKLRNWKSAQASDATAPGTLGSMPSARRNRALASSERPSFKSAPPYHNNALTLRGSICNARVKAAVAAASSCSSASATAPNAEFASADPGSSAYARRASALACALRRTRSPSVRAANVRLVSLSASPA